ncbi:hypothetical protein [Nitratiruptor sp. YY09-18]|uniref:hypothetical protein n=1 Tax=Nitratiruptor sp. YY09-18 TaxID=2724901 RepID=UPI0019156537|nr:hypothetical protein [Nitratiruptor sp. YY09-18]BCD67353.1 hypothetical protein NitYY0918_C0238 [Nitratiruptor sp. YY09-18]
MKIADVAQYATVKATHQTKEQIAVSLLKKSMEQTKQMMEELVKRVSSLQKMRKAHLVSMLDHPPRMGG